MLKEFFIKEGERLLASARRYDRLQDLRYRFGPLDWRAGADGATEVRPAILRGTEGGWTRMDALVEPEGKP